MIVLNSWKGQYLLYFLLKIVRIEWRSFYQDLLLMGVKCG